MAGQGKTKSFLEPKLSKGITDYRKQWLPTVSRDKCKDTH